MYNLDPGRSRQFNPYAYPRCTATCLANKMVCNRRTVVCKVPVLHGMHINQVFDPIWTARRRAIATRICQSR